MRVTHKGLLIAHYPNILLIHQLEINGNVVYCYALSLQIMGF